MMYRAFGTGVPGVPKRETPGGLRRPLVAPPLGPLGAVAHVPGEGKAAGNSRFARPRLDLCFQAVFQLDVSALQLELEQFLEVARMPHGACEWFEPNTTLPAVEEHATCCPSWRFPKRGWTSICEMHTQFTRIFRASVFGASGRGYSVTMLQSHAVAIASIVAASVAMVRLSLDTKALTFRTPRRCPSCGRLRRRSRCRCVTQ
jgi:hypothetical protein